MCGVTRKNAEVGTSCVKGATPEKRRRTAERTPTATAAPASSSCQYLRPKIVYYDSGVRGSPTAAPSFFYAPGTFTLTHATNDTNTTTAIATPTTTTTTDFFSFPPFAPKIPPAAEACLPQFWRQFPDANAYDQLRAHTHQYNQCNQPAQYAPHAQHAQHAEHAEHAEHAQRLQKEAASLVSTLVNELGSMQPLVERCFDDHTSACHSCPRHVLQGTPWAGDHDVCACEQRFSTLGRKTSSSFVLTPVLRNSRVVIQIGDRAFNLPFRTLAASSFAKNKTKQYCINNEQLSLVANTFFLPPGRPVLANDTNAVNPALDPNPKPSPCQLVAIKVTLLSRPAEADFGMLYRVSDSADKRGLVFMKGCSYRVSVVYEGHAPSLMMRAQMAGVKGGFSPMRMLLLGKSPAPPAGRDQHRGLAHVECDPDDHHPDPAPCFASGGDEASNVACCDTSAPSSPFSTDVDDSSEEDSSDVTFDDTALEMLE